MEKGFPWLLEELQRVEASPGAAGEARQQPDEIRHATPQPEPRSNVAAPRRFGQLLKKYREDLGLTQRTVADLLGVDTSTIARVESGARKPPRDAAFYHYLHDIPGLDDEHIQALLATEDAPELVVRDRSGSDAPPKPLPRVRIASAGGVQIALEMRGDLGKFAEEDLDRVLRSAKETTEVLLTRLGRRPSRPAPCSAEAADLGQLAAESATQIVEQLKSTASR